MSCTVKPLRSKVCSCDDQQSLNDTSSEGQISLLSAIADVRNLTRKMEVGRDKLSTWPSDKLVVYAEHSSLFHDIMTEQMADQARQYVYLLIKPVNFNNNLQSSSLLPVERKHRSGREVCWQSHNPNLN